MNEIKPKKIKAGEYLYKGCVVKRIRHTIPTGGSYFVWGHGSIRNGDYYHETLREACAAIDKTC